MRAPGFWWVLPVLGWLLDATDLSLFCQQTHKNCGFVNFERLDHAIEAVRTMHGRELGGNVVRLGYAKVPRDGVARPGSQESDYALVGAGSPPSNSLSWYDPATVEATPPQSHSRPILKAEAPSFEPSAAPPPPSLSQQIQMPQQLQDEYSMAIPELPEPRNARRVDQNRLREMRRRLELRQEMGGTQSAMLREVDSYFAECEDEFVELSTGEFGLFWCFFSRTDLSQ